MSTVVPVNQQSSEKDRAEEELQLQPEPEPEPEPQQAVSQSHFLKLPPEIRNEIYKHLLLAEKPIPGLNFVPGGTGPRGLHPNILATCSQIQREAQPILYEGNIMRVEFFSFLEVIKIYFRPAAHVTPLVRLVRKRLQQIKPFEIVYEYEIRFVKYLDDQKTERASREACRLLSLLNRIQFVSLDLSKIYDGPLRTNILQAWLSLRNVGRVALTLVNYRWTKRW